jgi:hypothetical protein
MAVRASSFEQASADYEDAVGSRLPRMTVWRATHMAGQLAAQHKAAEAEHAAAPAQPGEGPGTRRVEEVETIEEQGNISSDGTMILICGEGWKEAKMAACSRVRVLPPKGWRVGEPHRRREYDLRVQLDQHSYVAGLWGADEFARHQYAEGLRRGLDRVEVLTSVNDGALWIKRVTGANFPKAIQIVDWAHASGHVYRVAKVAWGEKSTVGASWVEDRLHDLWNGRVEMVVHEMDHLGLQRYHWPEGEIDPVGYFESNVDRMRYDAYRLEGYPIGSGTVEGGARNVVQLRMRRPGRGWNRDNANGMLALLGEYHSGRFDQAWRQLCQPVASATYR